MPRNITVKFEDGTSHVYQNAPDNITPEQVQARAEQEFAGKAVTALDGGRARGGSGKPATPKAAAQAKEDNLLPSDASNIYQQSRARLASRISDLPKSAQQRALAKFEASPAIRRLRTAQARPRTEVPAVKRAMEASAERRAEKNVSGAGNFLTGLKAGISRGMFGIPERVTAAAEAYLPSAITGNNSDASYDEILQQVRMNTDADLEKSTAGNILGQVLSGGLVGGAAAKTLTAGARATGLTRSAAGLARVAPKTTKAAALIAAGGAGGGAQALGEGSDVSTGAAVGAVGGPAVLGLGKAAGYLMRPVGDLMRVSKAGDLLRRVTSATTEEISERVAQYRARTGSEPTLYEVLPLQDRNKIAKMVVGKNPETSERAAAAVRKRVANVGPEMGERVRTASQTRRAQILGQMESDLATARGGITDISDPELAEAATRSPIDLKDFQRAEANTVMQPHEDTVVANRLQDVFPTSLENQVDEAGRPTGEVQEVFSDPEVNAALTNAASTLRLRLNPDNPSAAIAGLTANDATRILRQLAKVPPGTPQSGAAMRAEQVLMDHIEARAPGASQAIAQMRTSYAKRARMVEGMAEGGRTRTRESIPVETSGQARTVRNAYGSPEGTDGRFLGQSNVLGREMAGTTSDVQRAVTDLAENGQTQAALRQNLGEDVANPITEAAQAQAESVRNLSSLKESKNAAEALDVEDIGRMVLALNPAAMPTTKLFALSRLASLTHLPQSRANAIVDMLFSQDPAITNRAIGLLNNAGRAGKQFLSDLSTVIQIGARAGQVGNAAGEGGPSGEAQAAEVPTDEQNAEGDLTDNSGEQEFGSYGEMLDDVYANEDPEFLDLWQRQTGQESRRRQFDENGEPLRSSAGATGIAQVMPATGPEAAELAGLEWDPDAFENDEAYNELLGMAYMKEMLRRYDGDAALALAAYNAGPGAVDRAGGVPQIAETQDYVQKILGG